MLFRTEPILSPKRSTRGRRVAPSPPALAAHGAKGASDPHEARASRQTALGSQGVNEEATAFDTSTPETKVAAKRSATKDKAAGVGGDEDVLRANLRQVFDQYDNDGSGAVSTSEFEGILAATGIVMTPTELEGMIKETDVDGSGEIDFEEFYASLLRARINSKRAAEDGVGLDGLASLVSRTHTSSFQLFNPLSWFAPSGDAAEEGTPSARLKHELAQIKEEVEKLKGENAQLRSKQPPASPPSTERKRAQRTVTGSVRSQRSVLSEWMVKQSNLESATEQREFESELRALQRQRQEKFNMQQRTRIDDFKQAEEDKRLSIEAFKALKRETGAEMRVELRRAYNEVQQEKEKRAAIVSAKTLQVRRAKEVETAARYDEKRRNATATGLQMQDERRRRREENMRTIRKQEKASRDYAAQVRFETRPEVRKETREYFQALRDDICAGEREKQMLDRKEREGNRQQFLDRAHYWKKDRSDTKEHTQVARERLFDKRHRMAAELRNKLQSDQERMQQAAADLNNAIKERHDVVIESRFKPFDPEMSDVSAVWTNLDSQSPSIREGLKARSRKWSTPASPATPASQ